MTKSQRIIGYDIMRIIAASMVVCIHSNVYYLHNATDKIQWLAVMIMTALCVVSVPLFFMVSGACNIVKEETTSFVVLFKFKIPKTFIPFLVWSLIYVVLRIVTGKAEFTAVTFLSLIWEPAYYQFWFMYSLFGMYLCIPIFQFLILKSSKHLLQYILIFWLVSSLILPLLVRYVPGFRLSQHFDLIFLEGYWGYFFLGGYLRKYVSNCDKRTIASLFFLGLIITIGGAIIEWKFTPEDKYYGYWYSAYLLPGAAMMAVGVFLFFQDVKIKTSYHRVVCLLSELTMGVYYIHLLFITAYEMATIGKQPTFINAVVKLGVIVFVSFLACAILKKVKPLRKFLI